MKTRFVRIMLILLVPFLTGCLTPQQKVTARTVNVNGTGVILIQPDLLEIDVGVSYLAETTKEAQTRVNGTIQKVMEDLQSMGIASEDIKTTVISFRPEYQWTERGNQLIGQRARQNLFIIVRNVEAESKIAGTVFDILGNHDGIEIQGINFNVDDKTEQHRQAREGAYAQAREKAEEYAALSGMRLGNAISIREQSADFPPYPQTLRGGNIALMANSDGTQVPIGDISVTTIIQVEFELLP